MPMDTKLMVAILREQSEQLRKLSTELSANLETFEQTLGEQANSPAAHFDLLDWFAGLNGCLAATVEMFCQRLHTVLERTRPQLPSGSPRPTEDRSPPPPQPEPRERVLRSGTPRYAAFTDRARQAVEEARDAVAHADQSLARSRTALQSTEALFQHLRARREREAEHLPLLGIAPPPSLTAQESAAPPEAIPPSELSTKNEAE